MSLRIAILGSTRGSNMLPLIDAIKQRRLNAEIVRVLSNKQQAAILFRAQEQGITARYIPVNGRQREDYDAELSKELEKAGVDLIVLMGYMRILSSDFITRWQNKIINVHPSLLPDFAGLMDLEVHKAVLDSGKTESGCSVHYVIESVDAGPIILQKRCPVLASDTPETLKQRVQSLESEALIEAIDHYQSAS